MREHKNALSCNDQNMSQTFLLNAEQSQAVKATSGRILVLAGAGSGKTRVLTQRMIHLIQDKGVLPKAILGLTFTNKAAKEMRHRIASLLDPKLASEITLCTFHSFCMQLLRKEIEKLGYTPQFSLYDEKDISRLLALITRDLIEHEGELPSLSAAAAAINHAKNRGLSSNELPSTGSPWLDSFIRSAYTRLSASLRAYNAVDFDALLGLSVELFEKHPDVLERYQNHYQYIMIDEYQDTNPVQYRLAQLLAKKRGNLCVVGDDDQSIYGWRGADVKNILSFPADQVIKLEQNYRSTETILKAANAIIQKNTSRHNKVLWSDFGKGELIEVFHAPSEVEEAEAVVFRINRLRQEACLRWKDIAILYRSNLLSRPFEVALMKQAWVADDGGLKKGIPYQVHGGCEFYERREVKDLLAYMRFISNSLDEEALLRIVNVPRRGIGDAALDLITSFNRSKKMPLWEIICDVAEVGEDRYGLRSEVSSRAKKGIDLFYGQIKEAKERFKTHSVALGLRHLIENIHFKDAIKEEVKSEQMRAFKWENVQEFISSLEGFEGSLEEAACQFSLDPGFNQKKKDQENCVTLMTFHSAKGLEFPACFLVGMEDHIIPHEKSMKETGVEEERRLMYVAVTRAMRYLTISMAQKRKRMGQEQKSVPSRFLFEIPQDLMNVTIWDKV